MPYVRIRDIEVVRGNPTRAAALRPAAELVVPAAQKAGISRIGWQTFRHTHSTLPHALDVDPSKVSQPAEMKLSFVQLVEELSGFGRGGGDRKQQQ